MSFAPPPHFLSPSRPCYKLLPFWGHSGGVITPLLYQAPQACGKTSSISQDYFFEHVKVSKWSKENSKDIRSFSPDSLNEKSHWRWWKRIGKIHSHIIGSYLGAQQMEVLWTADCGLHAIPVIIQLTSCLATTSRSRVVRVEYHHAKCAGQRSRFCICQLRVVNQKSPG